MRMYENPREVVSEIARDLKEMGVQYVTETVQDQSGNWRTLELMNYCYSLRQVGMQADWEPIFEEFGIPVKWVEAELGDRLDFSLETKNPGRAWTRRADLWEQFLRNGQFSYTYAERIQPQFIDVVNELKRHPNSRQAIITMYDQHQDIRNLGGLDRIPCTMHWQFLIREGKVHCAYVMRSCDFKKFFIADAYMATRLQMEIAFELGYQVGTFTHFIGSLHVFKGEMEGIF